MHKQHGSMQVTVLGKGQTPEPDDAACDRDTAEVLQKLARRMMYNNRAYWLDICDGDALRDNKQIPAGYTYLAQLVAHDLVATIAPLPPFNAAKPAALRDYRAERMLLDTIYGGGPLSDPAPFFTREVDRNANGEKDKAILCRLGRIAVNEGLRRQLSTHESAILPNHPARDIPRASCPYLNGETKPGFTEALLADPRNDDNLIVSQMTTIFLELHNYVTLQTLPIPRSGGPLTDQRAYKHFLDVRKAVALVYRRIVVKDLLKRLLDREIFSRYEKEYDASFSPRQGSRGVSSTRKRSFHVCKEFSHAVFRFAHVMIRGDYVLNDTLKQRGTNVLLKDVLDRNSDQRPDLMPLSCDWLVDWKHFFELDPDIVPNLSRSITPDFGGGTLATDSRFATAISDADGGLIYRDLLRGASVKLKSLQNMIKLLPNADRQRSSLLMNSAVRRSKILEWLQRTGGAVTDNASAERIADDPPLYFYTLFEAAHDKCGARLGVLGSTVVAATIFGAIEDSSGVIEGNQHVTGLVNEVFGTDVPKSMPELIKFLQANDALKDVQCPS